MFLSLYKRSQSPSKDLLYFRFTCVEEVLLACISVYCVWAGCHHLPEALLGMQGQCRSSQPMGPEQKE